MRHLFRVAWVLLLVLASAVAPGIRAAGAPPPATRWLLLDACRVGPAVVAVGERGTILRSEDSGQTWKEVHCPVSATLTGISFSDTHAGWIVGHDGTVLASADGGASWTPQSTGAPVETSFLDVVAVDAATAVAVGAYGACYVTTDGGHAWARRSLLPEELHLNEASRGEGSAFYVAGERGTLLKLADAHAEAAPLQTGYDGSFNGLLVTGHGQLLAYGLRGHVYRSPDDGHTWFEIAGLPPVLLSAGVALSSGPIVLAGQARVFLLSQDGGKSFSSWPTPVTTAVARLLEAPDGSLLVFGEGGVSRLPAPAVKP